MKDEIKDLKEFVYENIIKVFNEHLNEFKKEYFSRIKNLNQHLLDEIQMYYESILITASEGSKIEDVNVEITIDSIREDILKGIENSVKSFYSSISSFYNSENLEKFSSTNKNNALKQFKLVFQFDEFKMKIIDNAKILKENTEKRYQLEQLEFIKRIESFIEVGFNESTKSFYENELSSYINMVISEDFEYELQPELNNFINIINNTDEFLIEIITQKETKQLSTLMRNRFNKLYLDLKDNITTNILPRIENIIYVKINKFRNEIAEKIINKFSEITSNEIKSNNFKNKISLRMYNLIPKTLRDPFKKRLIEIFQEISNEKSIKQMKETYKNQIENYLNSLNTLLNNYQEALNVKISKIVSTKSDNTLIILSTLHEQYGKCVREYNPIIKYEIDENKKNKIKDIEIYLYEKLKDIINSYEYQKNLGDTSIEKIIPNLKLYSEIIENELNANDKLTKTGRAKVNLQKILEKITNKFNEYFTNFEESVGNRNELIKIQRSNFRQLKEFSIEEIESEINLIENNYNSFANDILKIEEFVQLNSEYEKFASTLRKGLEKNTEYFSYAFESIKDYISEEQFEQFTKSLKEDSEKCKNIILKFLNEESSEVLNSIDLIQTGIKQLFTSDLRKSIDNKIDETLKDLYEGVLSQIKEMNKPNSGNIPTINLPVFTFNKFTNSYSGITISSTPSNINYNNLISFKRDDFTLIIENNVGAVVNYNARGSFNRNSYKYYYTIINGQIGNGNIGFKSVYDLKDNKVYLDAYQNQGDASYDKQVYYFNYNLRNAKTRLQRSETVIIQRSNSKHIIKDF